MRIVGYVGENAVLLGIELAGSGEFEFSSHKLGIFIVGIIGLANLRFHKLLKPVAVENSEGVEAIIAYAVVFVENEDGLVFVFRHFSVQQLIIILLKIFVGENFGENVAVVGRHIFARLRVAL